MSTALSTLPPEVTALRNTCTHLAEQNALSRFEAAVEVRAQRGITNDVELRNVDEMLSTVLTAADQVEAVARPSIAAAHSVHKALCDEMKAWKGRWEKLGDKLRKMMLDYKAEQKKILAQQQAALDKAAAEERERLAAEARAKLRDGDVAAAQVVMQQAQMTVAPVIANATPKTEYSKDRQVWEVRVTNPEELVKAIAAGTVPISVIKEWDETFMKREASKRGGLNWPGVEAKSKDALATSRRR